MQQEGVIMPKAPEEKSKGVRVLCIDGPDVSQILDPTEFVTVKSYTTQKKLVGILAMERDLHPDTRVFVLNFHGIFNRELGDLFTGALSEDGKESPVSVAKIIKNIGGEKDIILTACNAKGAFQDGNSSNSIILAFAPSRHPYTVQIIEKRMDLNLLEEGKYDTIKFLQMVMIKGVQTMVGVTDGNKKLIRWKEGAVDAKDPHIGERDLKCRFTLKEIIKISNFVKQGDLDKAKELMKDKFKIVVTELFNQAKNQLKTEYKSAEEAIKDFSLSVDKLSQKEFMDIVLYNYIMLIGDVGRKDQKEIEKGGGDIKLVMNIAMHALCDEEYPNFAIRSFNTNKMKDLLNIQSLLFVQRFGGGKFYDLAYGYQKGFIDFDKLRAFFFKNVNDVIENCPEAFDMFFKAIKDNEIDAAKLNILCSEYMQVLLSDRSEVFFKIFEDLKDGLLDEEGLKIVSSKKIADFLITHEDLYEDLRNLPLIEMGRDNINAIISEDGQYMAEQNPDMYKIVIKNVYELDKDKMLTYLRMFREVDDTVKSNSSDKLFQFIAENEKDKKSFYNFLFGKDFRDETCKWLASISGSDVFRLLDADFKKVNNVKMSLSSILNKKGFAQKEVSKKIQSQGQSTEKSDSTFAQKETQKKIDQDKQQKEPGS